MIDIDYSEIEKKLTEKHGKRMVSRFRGKTYYIPVGKVVELKKFIDREWNPVLDKGLATEFGIKKIPNYVRSLSFTTFLQEWYSSNFEKYRITFLGRVEILLRRFFLFVRGLSG